MRAGFTQDKVRFLSLVRRHGYGHSVGDDRQIFMGAMPLSSVISSYPFSVFLSPHRLLGV